MAEPVLADPVFEGSVFEEPGRPRRWPKIVAVVVAALVLAGAGVLGGLWLSKDNTNASAQDSGSSAVEDPPAAEDSDEGAEEEEAEKNASEPPAPATVTCWDGVTASTSADCAELTGPDAVGWVFPSLKTQTCEDRSASQAPKGERLVMIQCFEQLDDGTLVKLNYSQWKSVQLAYDHYEVVGSERTDEKNGAGKVVRHRWLALGQGQFKAAMLYADQPWSVSLYAPTEEARAEGVRTLVTARKPAELRDAVR